MAEGSIMGCGLGEKMATQKISVTDHTKGTENSDSIVIDIETVSHASTKDASNARITRNLSRKGSQRGGGEKKMNSSEWNSIVGATSTPRATCVAGPTAGLVGAGDGTPGSPAANNGSNSQQAHQITIDTSSTCADGGRGVLRRSNSRRYSTWGLDPKRIFMLLASLSSMGTMLMIYFTLSISKKVAEENGMELEWQQ